MNPSPFTLRVSQAASTSSQAPTIGCAPVHAGKASAQDQERGSKDPEPSPTREKVLGAGESRWEGGPGAGESWWEGGPSAGVSWWEGGPCASESWWEGEPSAGESRFS